MSFLGEGWPSGDGDAAANVGGPESGSVLGQLWLPHPTSCPIGLTAAKTGDLICVAY